MESLYSNIIRKHIYNHSSICYSVKELFKKDDEFFDGLLINYLKMEEKDFNSIFGEKIGKINNIIKEFSKLVLVTDMYVILKEKAALKSIDERDRIILDCINITINTDIFDTTIYNYGLIFNLVNNSITYLNIPRYRKVLMMYTLTDDDIDLLRKFNPLFLEEYYFYHQDLTSTFIIEEIDNIKHYQTYQYALQEISYLIANLLWRDEYSVNDILLDMAKTLSINIDELYSNIYDENYTYMVNVIKDYYDSNKKLTFI